MNAKEKMQALIDGKTLRYVGSSGNLRIDYKLDDNGHIITFTGYWSDDPLFLFNSKYLHILSESSELKEEEEE